MADESATAVLAKRLEAARRRRGWSRGKLAEAAGISRTTLHHLEKGRTKEPREQTLRQLADALGLPLEELLVPVEESEPVGSPRRASDMLPVERNDPRAFDRRTNPVVRHVAAESPEMFAGWTEWEWNELYSSFGTGGALNRAGVVQAARHINRKREALRQLDLVLETHLADVAIRIVRSLYEMVHLPAAPTADGVPHPESAWGQSKPESER